MLISYNRQAKSGFAYESSILQYIYGTFVYLYLVGCPNSKWVVGNNTTSSRILRVYVCFKNQVGITLEHIIDLGLRYAKQTMMHAVTAEP